MVPTARLTPKRSNRAARSAHNFFAEYSEASRGLSVLPYPSMSGTTTREPLRTHGPTWCRQPYLEQQDSRKIPLVDNYKIPEVGKAMYAEKSGSALGVIIVRELVNLVQPPGKISDFGNTTDPLQNGRRARLTIFRLCD